MPRTTLILLTSIVVMPAIARAQQRLNLDDVAAALDKDGRIAVGGGSIVIEKYDYEYDDKNVEAVVIHPAQGRHPGILLIPGHSRSARDYIPLGVRFAREGFTCLAITQRGYGRSEGEPDFVGPKTMGALEAGLKRFAADPHVDPDHIGVFGYSRGAMAASLLATRSDHVKAAVFAAGIYDFKKAYEEITLEGIRQNMEKEAGLGDEAASERSAINRMQQLQCPVLILHGEKDVNAPVAQAYALRDRLKELGKPHEVQIFPDKDHDIGMQALLEHTLKFFRRTLMPGR